MYREESWLLLALLRMLWHPPYQDLHDWLVAWLAQAARVFQALPRR